MLAAVAEIAAATGVQGMVGGQYMDVAGEAAADDDLRTLHALKTGRLIQAAVVCGALLSGAEDVEPYRAFAAELGLLFQIVDDILDETGAEDELGKSVGKDKALDKVTYVSRFGMERAVELADETQRRALKLLGRAARRHGRPRRRRPLHPRAEALSSAGLEPARAAVTARGAASGPVLYSGDDAVSGQDLRPRRPPTILRARADAARRRGPRDHPRVRQRDRRSPGAQPGDGRAHRGAAQRAQQSQGQDRLGRGPPVLRAQAAHRPPRPVRHHPPVRRALRVPEPRRVAARRDRHGARLDVHQLRPGTGRGPAHRPRGRRQRGLRARRRGAHGRSRLRGPQPGGPPAHAARRRAQRQRDVDPRQRRRAAALPQPAPPRPDAHAPARGPGARRRAHPGHRPPGLPPRQGRQGVDEGVPGARHALRGAGVRLHRRRRRARHARAAAEHPPGHRDAPSGGRARQDHQGQGVRARRGPAGRVPRHRARSTSATERARPRRSGRRTRRRSATRWCASPNATSASSPSPRP